MTLLEIVQRAARKLAVPVPSSVVGNPDETVRLLWECANDEGLDLASKWEWQALRREWTFTAENTIAQPFALPADLSRIIPDTFFNRSQRRRCVGPLNAQEWQTYRATVAPVVFDAFRIQAGVMEILPAPAAGAVYAFEYVTRQWVKDATGNARETFAADTDEPLVDGDAIRLGAIWRFKQSRGFDYAEDMRNAEIRRMELLARDGTRRTVNLAGPSEMNSARLPLVPEGNWFR